MSRKTKVETRPWGEFSQFAHNEECTVKTLKVKAGNRLSLQSHKKRDELWVALDDGAIVELDGKKMVLKKGEEVFILRNSKHRLSAGDTDIRVLEVSFGYFDEEDEIRWEDDYNRVKE